MDKRNHYCVALQPICNADLLHVADELLYRSAATAVSANVEDDLIATARACNAAFYETGIENLCDDRNLFFNAPRAWLLDPDLLPPNPEKVVIEILESVDVDEELLIALKNIKRLGYTIALDDFVLTPKTSALLDIADIIKLDVLEYLPHKDDIALYKAKGIVLLAEKVESMEEFEHYKSLGFTLFQGYFYARPEVKSAKSVKRSSNANVRLGILKELYTSEVDINKVEQLLMFEPQLVLRLLRMINSAQYKRVSQISSVQQAITTLGLEKLKTLVSTLVLANDDPCKMLLLPKVLTRAAMCQRLAQNEFTANPEEAFMVGLLSLADLMLNQELELICQQLPISDDIRNAVVSHQGKLGRILSLTINFEKAELYSASDKTIDILNKRYLESRSWATSALVGLS